MSIEDTEQEMLLIEEMKGKKSLASSRKYLRDLLTAVAEKSYLSKQVLQ